VQRLIDNSDRLVILDLYADWCISCKTMERNVFPAPEVARRLSQFTLLRADVTANDAVDRALLDHYGLFGPPSLVFFGDDGSEIADFRIQGEIGAASFADHLGTVLSRYEPDSEGKVGQIAANSR
jgi:thiol:disulfide interchange protein DsbD